MDMRNLRWSAVFYIGIGLSLFMTACGGGSTTPPPPTTYVLTVNSTNPASGVAIVVAPADNNGAANGTTNFTRTYNAGTSVTLTAPAKSGSDSFVSWTGCTSTVTCTVALNANTTVTANYAVPAVITPTVTVTPSASSITTAQALTVTVGVSGGSGNPTPTGTVTLTSGSYTTAAMTLEGSPPSAPIVIPAGSLATGSDTLTVTYTPDTASSSIYSSATGTNSVTVTAPAKITPTVTVTPSASSITTAQALTVTVAVSGGTGNPTPTGTVTLTSGSYTSATVALSSGSATINVPAGSLATGSDTLTVTYTPDTASSSTYNSASGTSPVTVTQAYVLTVDSTNPASGVSIQVTPNPLNPLSSLAATPFTQTLNAGATILLTAPTSAGSNTFASWTGCTSTSTVNCTATLNANMTVTANYTITPMVTVTPSASSITTTQALTVTVAVSGGSGNPTPTGSVKLTSGSYTSATVALSGGSATINVAAGSLATGSDTLTVSYTPDTASSSTYNSASGTAPETVTAAITYTLTVDSADPATGVYVTASPADNNSKSYEEAPFTFTYNAGQAVVLTVLSTSGSYSFESWTGCTSTSTETCDVTLNANGVVTATYSEPTVTSISVMPSTATIGSTQKFTATVVGNGSPSQGVTWSVAAPSGSTLSPGTISSTGLYTTPYPAPATVTVTATSTQSGFTNVSGSATVTLSVPGTTTGPALAVNVGTPGNPINPDIYGMNNYTLDASAAKAANITVDRFGGDATSRYNYLLDVTNAASDWYFENGTGATGVEATSEFNAQVASDASMGAKTLGTVDVLGWVAKNGTSCSFPASTYPNQYAHDPYNANCGDGELANQTDITGNDPTVTSIAEGPSFAGDWVAYLVSKFGTAASGGVFAYDLDNEPAWWDAVHRDVHPVASTYDEVTNNGIATAEAIKTADPTAQVNGPVVDYWWNYFYSKKDIENGWGTGPCYSPWSGPIDREAHGGVPFIEYYLQQFAAASTTYGSRLLDFVDLHTYFAAEYPAGSGNSVASTTAGDTGAQQARLNSTRVFWDPTYFDSSNNYPQPNYSTNPSSLSCTVPQQAPQLIPMMQKWVANDYPGTKTAITEYNWGGQGSINGAVAQADILGIFGSYGLDLGTLWGPPNPTTQVPGLMAFEIYRNYDGAKSTFGDTVLASTSANQGTLAVYGALRSSDSAVTVVVINKTYGDLKSTLSLTGLTGNSGTAQAYLYSNANLAAIVAQPAVAVTPPGTGGTLSTISYTFPAQSITLFVVPQ
jgi:hypothetical protein